MKNDLAGFGLIRRAFSQALRKVHAGRQKLKLEVVEALRRHCRLEQYRNSWI
jgi:hypothetical protein